MSQLKVNALVSYSGNTVTLGTSGDTINVASGVTFNTASATVTLPTTIKVDTIQNTNSSTLITQTNSTTITVGVSGQTVALPSQSISYAAISNPVNFRNRIINGDMEIDQRNAGASVSIANTGAFTYTLDRWAAYGNQLSKFSVQQNAASVTPPVGFSYYLGATSSSAYSVISTDTFYVGQVIEGYNIADLGWGTANAKTVTLSFWVRSSLTGTFGGALQNSGFIRSYPFSYSISSANTWEYKTVTIVGDTSGSWQTTNGHGISVFFGLGQGTSTSATAGAWAAGNFNNATGATSVVGTNGATLYITGVQLEAGSQASGFEFLPVDVNLARCQRYFEIFYLQDYSVVGQNYSTSANITPVKFAVQKRATPTATLPSVGTTAGTIIFTNSSGTNPSTTTGSITASELSVSKLSLYGSGFTSSYTAGHACLLYSSGGSQIKIDSEL
jgi:hypothetical protein